MGVTAAVLATAVPSSASASNLYVNFGANTGAYDDCSEFTFTETADIFSSNSDCASSALGMSAGSASSDWSADWSIVAPPGITINRVFIPDGDLTYGEAANAGWYAGEHWANGDVHWSVGQLGFDTQTVTPDMGSQWWQFWLACGSVAGCPGAGIVAVSGIELSATDTVGPSLIAVGANNLYYQGGAWVWNPAGDPWPVPLSGTDPTGVCSGTVSAGTQRFDIEQLRADDLGWQECANLTWTSPTVDTQALFPGRSGQVPLQIQDTNAAGLTSTANTTINVDNVPPTVSLTATNDPTPGGWAVNHAVTVHVDPQAGPSGVSSVSCTVDGAPTSLDADDDLTVDGNGAHTVNCTVQNNAIDPQGQHNSGSGSLVVDIDEQAPTVSFVARDPANPAQVVAQTSDDESLVTGGTIELAPQGSSDWQQLPTSFTSSGELVTTIPDANLNGAYTVRAQACSAVGNCGTSDETLRLPLRAPATSAISFSQFASPKVVITRRVRAGNHVRTLRFVIRANTPCASEKVKTGRRRWHTFTVCRAMQLQQVDYARVSFGATQTVRGVLTTAGNVPLAGAPVTIETAPQNGLGAFAPVGTVTTSGSGAWSFRLPAGPSRTVEAVYGGSPLLLPATSTATVTVPAKLTLSATPSVLPWSGVVTFRGQLEGGYVPADGVALRLLVRYRPGGPLTSLLALRTDATGRFTIRWTYGGGRGRVTYPFYVATTATESDYPFASATTPAVRVTFDG